ncbi:hypothetical protein [Burkholderia pseudomultivorans]|uniref:hypothetical protein n=1 Tax=Burkholderia pseudomultivorans TaxID=1207504 RepID=UPI0012D85EEB|nr:hypothetical protein [Burkholderia pseudomultivorans]
MQYRSGAHGKIEYQFPEKCLPPRGKISIVNVSGLRDGLGGHLKFVDGRYTYVVSNALVPGDVYVAKDWRLVFDGICKGSAYYPFDDDVRSGLEYGVVDAVDSRP